MVVTWFASALLTRSLIGRAWTCRGDTQPDWNALHATTIDKRTRHLIMVRLMIMLKRWVTVAAAKTFQEFRQKLNNEN